MDVKKIFTQDLQIAKFSLIGLYYQMDSFEIIGAADADNTIVSLGEVPKFGVFKGVIGRVAR